MKLQYWFFALNLSLFYDCKKDPPLIPSSLSPKKRLQFGRSYEQLFAICLPSAILFYCLSIVFVVGVSPCVGFSGRRFLGVAEGLLPDVPAGIEEVTAIATLQALLGTEHARAKLLRLPQVQ